MEFVIWIGVALVAVALAGSHLFEVVVLAAAVQLGLAIASVLSSSRNYSAR